MLTNINHITLATKDINRSFSFYQNIMGFKPLCKWDNGAYFLVGDFWFCLNVDERDNPTENYTHYAFSVTQENFPKFVKKISVAGVKTFKENTSPGDSVYFLDPDGHKLEVHTGDWRTRMKIKQEIPGNWKNVEWYI